MEDKTQASSEVNQVTGHTQVDPNDFLAEEEQATEEPSQAQEPVEETETSEEKPSEEPKQVQEEAPLYAGKFKDEKALRDAFTQLGGNPDDYTDAKLLEEAYRVREREFSKTRQQIAELEKAQGEEKQTEAQKDEIKEVVEKLDWSKIKTYNDLVAETLKVADQMYQGRFSEMKKSLIDEVVSTINTREQTAKELADLEADVPRLKADGDFRTAFAHFITGQKASGKFQNLKESMKSFLVIGQKISEEVASEKKAQEEAKGSAQTTETKADDKLSASGAKDEVEEIIGAFSKRKNLFG